MSDSNVAKFLGERQNVHAECHRAQPFRDGASHVQLPSAIFLVPFSRIRT